MIYYVDVDDTLVRTVGSKMIPITATITWMKALDLAKDQVYLWSRGGAEYARSVAVRLEIEGLFAAFLPKPDILVDDQDFSEWSHLLQWHPNQLTSGPNA